MTWSSSSRSCPGPSSPGSRRRSWTAPGTRLAAAEESGLLAVVNADVAFRHELTRMAVLGAVPGARQLVLHRRVLDALVALGDADPGRLVHHAVACGDVDTVVREGPRAARRGGRFGIPP